MRAVARLGLILLAWTPLTSDAGAAGPPVGALNPDVTQATIQQTICIRGWTNTVRPSLAWTEALKWELWTGGALPGSTRDYDLDHLIPLALGGAPRDPANLWLQPWSDARRKDDDEWRLHHAVCTGQMTLEAAQAEIRRLWGAN